MAGGSDQRDAAAAALEAGYATSHRIYELCGMGGTVLTGTWLLHRIVTAARFFETLERVVTAVTGAVPREDELGEEGAREVVAEISEEQDAAEPVTISARD